MQQYWKPDTKTVLTPTEQRVLELFCPLFHLAAGEAWRYLRKAKVTRKNGYRILEKLLRLGLIDTDREAIGNEFAMTCRTGRGDLQVDAMVIVRCTSDTWIEIELPIHYGESREHKSDGWISWNRNDPGLWYYDVCGSVDEVVDELTNHLHYDAINVALEEADGTMTPLFYQPAWYELDQKELEPRPRQKLTRRKTKRFRQRKRRLLARQKSDHRPKIQVLTKDDVEAIIRSAIAKSCRRK